MRRFLYGKLCWNVAGLSAIVLFLGLLFFHLDLIGPLSAVKEKPVLLNEQVYYGESWMEIIQAERKIGYCSRKREKTVEGNKFSEEIYMRINTMGVIQPIKVKTSANLSHSGEVVNFTFSIDSGLFQFTVDGKAENGKILIRIGDEANAKVLPVASKIYLGGSIVETAGVSEMNQGESRTFTLFDPATLSSREITITSLGDENLTVMGKIVSARKLSIDVMGIKQFAWVSPAGFVIREEGIMGIVLQSVSEKQALSGLNDDSVSDLTVAASIQPSNQIVGIQDLKALVVRLHNLPAGRFLLDGGRQMYNEGLLTVRSEKHLKKSDRGNHQKDIHLYLKPEPFIQSNIPEIQRKASEIVGKEDDDQRKAEKLVAWVYKNIAKKPVISVPDALQTLKNRMGDCNEHAVLLAALARAAGLPAQIETGLVYVRGSFFFHAWNVLYIDTLGGWVTADAALGQMPADVTHLRFARGALENQADLAGLIGRLKIDIVRMEK